MSKDYYTILGVNKQASKEEIKKQFHKLAHKYHPDKSGGDEAKFKEINEAYQVLSDDQKRAQYDTYGSNFSGQAGTGGFSGFGAEGFDFSGFTGGAGAGGFEFDLGDIFGDIFGGGRGGRQRRGRDISVDIQISFEESIFGTDRKLLINKVSHCDTCKGSGAETGSKNKTCDKCNGKGKLNETRKSFMGSFTVNTTCNRCFGKGEIPEKMCKDCSGDGVKKKSEEIKIHVPAGIEAGEMIRMSGQGEAISAGLAGDLYIKVHIEQHKIFKRDGTDLRMDLHIKVTDALLGSNYTIKTLEQEDLTVKIPAGVASGEILRVKDKGVPIDSKRRGNLLIKITIDTPTKLSKKAQKLIEELRQEGI